VIVETVGLSRAFRQRRGLFQRPRLIRAVNEVDLAVEAGSCLGIVGESGCGKSTLGRLLLGLLKPSAGSVRLFGRDIAGLAPEERRRLRRDIALVQQNPRAALDPRWRVGAQVAEPIAIHEPGRDRAGREAAMREAFEAVGLDHDLAARYPHQISGGQRQRVVLARALVLRPKLVVMDEPTSALDVSVQAQVMQVIADLQRRYGLAYVFISHDLRNLRRIADRIAVMYAGRVVEEGPADRVCRFPLHPYTKTLLAAVPSLTERSAAPVAQGEPPDPGALPSGCAFHPRCALAVDICRAGVPVARAVGASRVACHLAAPPADAMPAPREPEVVA
jgi:oligopeptide/dipeptide ABC transporter ATP-binding protein